MGESKILAKSLEVRLHNRSASCELNNIAVLYLTMNPYEPRGAREVCGRRRVSSVAVARFKCLYATISGTHV